MPTPIDRCAYCGPVGYDITSPSAPLDGVHGGVGASEYGNGSGGGAVAVLEMEAKDRSMSSDATTYAPLRHCRLGRLRSLLAAANWTAIERLCLRGHKGSSLDLSYYVPRVDLRTRGESPVNIFCDDLYPAD